MTSSLFRNITKNCEIAPKHYFQIHRVWQYLSGQFYIELWQSNELLRAAAFMTHPPPPSFFFDFHRKSSNMCVKANMKVLLSTI